MALHACLVTGVYQSHSMNFSTNAHAELLKAKALSHTLCQEPLMANANKCIRVNRKSALFTFGGSYLGIMLSCSTISLALGNTSATAIAKSLGEDSIASSSRANVIKDILKRL